MNPVLAVLAGVLAGLWLPPPVSLAVMAVGAPLLCVLLWWLGGTRALLGVTALCFAWAHGLDYARTAGLADAGADRLVTGCVADIPRAAARGQSFRFHVAEFGMLYLRTYEAPVEVQAGQCYRLQVRLKPPHGQQNRWQFDRGLWLMRERIVATGYVRDSRLNRHVRAADGRYRWLRVRAALAAALATAVDDHRVAGVVQGLVLGARGAISQAQWEVFRRTGTLHLMAISGLHVTLVAGVAWLVMRWLPLPGQRWTPVMRARLAAVLAATGYALLAGWTVPASRAALMVATIAWLTAGRRVSAALAGLWLALAVTLLGDPFSVLGSGFWMSYVAVGLLLTAPPVRRHGASAAAGARHYLAQLLAAQWRLGAGLALPSLVLFGGVVPMAPFINLLAIPLFTLLLPAVLSAAALALACTPCGMPLAQVTQALAVSLATLEGWAASPAGDPVAPPGILPTMLLIAGCGLLLAGCHARRAVGLLLIAGAWLLPAAGDQANLTVDVLDVGQGTAVVVRTARHAVLLDTGPAWRDGNAGDAVVLPFLRGEGVERLDLIIVSHADSDHSGGLQTVRSAHPEAAVVRSSPAGADELACLRGMAWEFDGWQFRVLHPARRHGWGDNDASCVLALEADALRLLFPGDIERIAEAVVTAREPELRSALVLAPHHGSRTSSSAALVAATRPDFLVYTAGYRNRWGFPAPAVVGAWAEHAGCQLNTATAGALRFTRTAGQGLRLSEVRAARLTRPWVLRAARDKPCLDG